MNEMTFTAHRLTSQRDAALVAETDRRRSIAEHGTRIGPEHPVIDRIRRTITVLHLRRPGPRRVGPAAA